MSKKLIIAAMKAYKLRKTSFVRHASNTLKMAEEDLALVEGNQGNNGVFYQVKT